MYKLGLVSISFRDKSPEEILIAMKNAGLSYVEWGSDIHAPFNDLNKVKEVCELQKKHKIECCSYGTYFRLGVTPLDELEGYITAAKILGTDILRLWCGDKNSQEYSEEERKALFAQCRVAANLAETHNVKLCMECHHWTYTNKSSSALELIREVASPNFCMYWQPNQFTDTDTNLEYAYTLSPYTKHIHVFNWKGHEKYPLIDAVDLWKKYLSQFKCDRTLLLEFMPDDNIESLKAEADALRKIVGE